MKRKAHNHIVSWGIFIFGLTYAACAAAQTPYGGTPRPVPGIIQAEDFDEGGEGVAYHSLTLGNAGGAYRNTDIDIYPTTDGSGGQDVYIHPQEWLRYTVDVAEAGAYRVVFRLTSASAPVLGGPRLSVDGNPVSAPADIPGSMGAFPAPWASLIIDPVLLPQGRHVLQLDMTDLRLSWDPTQHDTEGIRLNQLQFSLSALHPQIALTGATANGFADGPAATAMFSTTITGVDVDRSGNVLVADAGNLRLRKIAPDGQVTTLAGNGTSGRANGTGAQAQFLNLDALALDDAGVCYVAEHDMANAVNRIRKITPDGTVTTFYQGSMFQQPLPAIAATYFGMTIDANNRILLNASLVDGRYQNYALIALRDGVQSVIAYGQENPNGAVNYVPEAQLASGHSTTVYSLVRNWSNSANIAESIFVRGPDGWTSSQLLTQCECYGAYSGLAATPAGGLYVAYDGAVYRISRDDGMLLNGAGPGLNGPLAADYAGDVYGYHGTRFSKIMEGYGGCHLAAFTLGGGSVSVDQIGPYQTNTVIQVSASPSAGLAFLRWQGDVSGDAPSLSLLMDTSKTAQAVFGAALTTPAATGGTVLRTPDQNVYELGATVTLEAKPSPGFEFLKWSDGKTNLSRTVIVSSAISLQPTFAALPEFTLNAQVLGGIGGSVEATPSKSSYYRDTQVTLVARPSASYVFQTWLDGNLDNPRTLVIRSNTTVFAVFAPDQGTAPTIVSAPQTRTVVAGESTTFRVTASGSAPLEYQWAHAGTNLAGATGSTFTIASVQASDAGTYTVAVHNSVGSRTSSAELIVMPGAKPGIGKPSVSGGKLHILITGAVGEEYNVESSTDLRSWTLVTALANTQGTVTFEEPTPSANRFYRVLRTK